MINLNELEQFVLFAKTGSLSQAAEYLHISAPTLSRSMQNIENTFGVQLFNRTKNRLILNATGLNAVEYSKALLAAASDTLTKVKDYDRSLQTIVIKSCAPAPLWKLIPSLNTIYPSMTISSSICDLNEIDVAISDNSYDILILPYLSEDISEDLQLFFMEEHLFVCVKNDHELATKSSVTMKELNGYNFLLRSELGFWDRMCRQKMPSSKFLVQNDEFEFTELVNNSSLPSFVTDVTIERHPIPKDRVAIPISDSEANVSFFVAVSDASKYKLLLSKLECIQPINHNK